MNKWQETELTWVEFLEELRTQFYPITTQGQKEKEFMELRMTSNMTAYNMLVSSLSYQGLPQTVEHLKG